ncbi:MAG: hypothetical protein MMC33_007743 [Icmadophila ericetorum]|nr:hypothetical protein [Icmadophila ericetorum]
MSQFYPPNQQNPPPSYSAQNLQFYPSSYGAPPPVSGHSTPAAAQYTSYGPSSTASQAYTGASSGYGGMGFMSSAPGGGPFGTEGPGVGVSGRMGEQGGLRTGWLAAFGTEGYEGEPPLLEELGVNFGHIRDKTLTVLNPIARIDQHIMDDSDLAGPILFFALFGAFLLLSGKLHFGYIYGLAAVGSFSLHTIFSLMSNPLIDSSSSVVSPGMGMGHHMSGMGHDSDVNGNGGGMSSTLTFFKSASVLGYCLLPLVLTSVVGVILPMDTLMGYILTSLAVAWCTYSSSGMFCAVGRMRSMRPLVAYPLMLFYVGFGIMGIFSSRGSGGLEARVGRG